MKYTFEISIAGCNTQCLHCYVSGGKAPLMSYDDYTFTLTYLSAIFQKMNGDISLTIGYENFLHPDIAKSL